MQVSLMKVSLLSDTSLISVSLLSVSVVKVFFWSISLRAVSHNTGVSLMRVSPISVPLSLLVCSCTLLVSA